MNAACILLASLCLLPAAPRLEVAVHPRAVAVGESVTVSARVVGGDGAVRPGEPGAAEAFVLVEVERGVGAGSDGFAQSWIAAAPGEHALPPVVATFEPRDGGPIVTLRSDVPPRVTVTSALQPGEGEALLDDLEISRPPAVRAWTMPALLAAAALAALVALRMLVRRRTGSRATAAAAPAAAPPASAAALARLRALQRRAFAEGEESRAALAELSDIVRDFVAARFGVPATVRTTDEVLPLLGALGAERGAVGVLLGEAETAKYAGRVPRAAAVREAVDAMAAWVRGTGAT